jgi:ankyrin repeat protein
MGHNALFFWFNLQRMALVEDSTMRYSNHIFSNTILLMMVNISLICTNSIEVCAQEIRFKSFFENELEQTSHLIVVLKVDFNEGSSENGAGIIFGHEKDRLFIATANHVVHRGALQPANIWVSFKTMPGKKQKATISKHIKSGDLDLEVLTIENLANLGINPCAFPYERLRMFDDLKPGDSVYLIGNPGGDAWAKPVQPDKVSQFIKKEIIFQSASISAGHSGGALIDKTADILGLITADQPPFGRAININDVLKQVKLWGYPSQLSEATFREYRTGSNLHDAALNGDLDKIKNLLANCYNPNEIDNVYVTPLHLAAAWGHTEAVSLLLKAGGDLNAQDLQGGFPLNHAVDNSQGLETVKFLLQAGAGINNINNAGRTVLHSALDMDTINNELVFFLINAGADVNVVDFDGNAPLHYAVKNGNVEIVKALLKAGANIEVEDKDHITPLNFAIDGQNLEIVKLLISSGVHVNGQHWPALQRAASRPESIEIIRALLIAGANVNAVDEDGNTALHQVVVVSGNNDQPVSVNQQLEAMSLLLKAGANVNIKNGAGHTVLARSKIALTDPLYNTEEKRDGNIERFKEIEKLLLQYKAKL